MGVTVAYPLRVSENRRFLTAADGSPFFWLGDTAWELFHRLDRDDARLYLENRAERGFNVVQAVALGEINGIRVPNAYGRRPLKQNEAGCFDPTMPDTDGDYSYWDHVDYIVDTAAELGICIAFLPTWGDKYYKSGEGPQVFTAANARIYGEFLGHRYANKPNIVWVMGGDRPLETKLHFDVNIGMAQGLKAGDGGAHLMTFHPRGDASSSMYVHDEEWLDFNMIQSGHHAQNLPNYKHVEKDYALTPVKPTLDGEPRYEDHPVGFNAQNGYFDDYDTRVAAYWAVFAGGFGHTYGHHSIWYMCTEPMDYWVMTWKEAIMRPGATQLRHLKDLVLSRPFLERVPDQGLLASNFPGANHQAATRGKDYAFIYTPNGIRIEANMGIIEGDKVKAWWLNPRNGERTDIGVFDNTGTASFVAPSRGRKDDWVLVLDNADKY